MQPTQKMQDKVTYYITPGDKKRLPDWQQARSIDQYNLDTVPYDKNYYLKKLNDWVKRHGEFLTTHGESHTNSESKIKY